MEAELPWLTLESQEAFTKAPEVHGAANPGIVPPVLLADVLARLEQIPDGFCAWVADAEPLPEETPEIIGPVQFDLFEDYDEGDSGC
jgi:hypothetical protein